MARLVVRSAISGFNLKPSGRVLSVINVFMVIGLFVFRNSVGETPKYFLNAFVNDAGLSYPIL